MNAIFAASCSETATTIPDSRCAASNPHPAPLDFLGAHNTLTLQRLEKLDTLVVSKSCSGFDRSCVDELADLLRRIGRGEPIGELTGLKYLVFDFAHEGAGAAEAADGFEELAATNAELILDAPVISIAWTRGFIIGADLDFALSCSMIVAERGARFSFETDPIASIGVYGSLAQKIGFVKAERLMENGEVVGADDMRNLLLVKQVADREAGLEGIERYIGQCGRRYNASYSLFRAQRIAMPPAPRRSALAPAMERAPSSLVSAVAEPRGAK
ncbi:MAG: enoyl-CoA hydratase [Methylocystis sp.]|nr:enoyl-CoA hydratase [Methylocystis sp.]MBI3275490.1 enoyl-CoA hydratase [Methylocystis sp.]